MPRLDVLLFLLLFLLLYLHLQVIEEIQHAKEEGVEFKFPDLPSAIKDLCSD